jgi:hypothetical protein
MLGESDTLPPEIMLQKQMVPEPGLRVIKADFNIRWDDIILYHGIPLTGDVSAGNFIVFDGDPDTDTMEMIYGPTNTLIGSWQFGSINGTGPGTTPTPPPVVTRVSSNDAGFSGVTAGDLLVVMPNHRTGTFTTDGETCTAAGFTTVEVASWYTGSGDRRAVALLVKVADGSEEGDSVTCTWGSGATTYATLYQVYTGATTWTDGATDVDHGAGSSTTSSVSISGLPTSTTANVLTIGALVTRNDPGTVTMTNLGSQDIASSGGTYPCVTVAEFNYGDAVTETDMSLSTAQQASGMLVQIECTD